MTADNAVDGGVREEEELPEGESGSAVISTVDEGKRLDAFLPAFTGLSRSKIQTLIAAGLVTVNGAPARKKHAVVAGEEVAWEVPAPTEERVVPEALPLHIVYEDEHLVVVDKPPGMVMYPGLGHPGGTLLNALMARYPDIAGVGGEGRPGVFHRLDRDTSGLVAVARSEAAYQSMVQKIAERDVERIYLALVTGDIPTPRGMIDAPLGRSVGNRTRMAVRQAGGREAITRFEVLERFPQGYTLVEARLETGRTHQIRVHFSFIKHPVAGDPTYSRGRGRRELGLERQLLHAHRQVFDHPITGEHLDLMSDLPPDLATVLKKLRYTA